MIARGLAVQATGEKIIAHKKSVEHEKGLQAERDESAASQLRQLDGKTLALKVRSSERGHLFRGLHATDVVVCIQEKMGLHIEPGMLSDFPASIKEIGQYKLTLAGGGKKAVLTLAIEREEGIK